MVDKELLEAIGQMMDGKLHPIVKRLDSVEQKIDTMQMDIDQLKEDTTQLKEDVVQLKEDSEITRSGVNTLLEWAEECGNVIKFPLPKVK